MEETRTYPQKKKDAKNLGKKKKEKKKNTPQCPQGKVYPIKHFTPLFGEIGRKIVVRLPFGF